MALAVKNLIGLMNERVLMSEPEGATAGAFEPSFRNDLLFAQAATARFACKTGCVRRCG